MKISILGTEYNMDFLEEIHEEDNSENIISEGVCDTSNRSIKIATKRPDGTPLPQSEIVKNVLHELFHAILDEGQYIDLGSNEPLVEWLARCTYNVMEQIGDCKNPSFLIPLQDPRLGMVFFGQEGKLNRD